MTRFRGSRRWLLACGCARSRRPCHLHAGDCGGRPRVLQFAHQSLGFALLSGGARRSPLAAAAQPDHSAASGGNLPFRTTAVAVRGDRSSAIADGEHAGAAQEPPGTDQATHLAPQSGSAPLASGADRLGCGYVDHRHAAASTSVGNAPGLSRVWVCVSPAFQMGFLAFRLLKACGIADLAFVVTRCFG